MKITKLAHSCLLVEMPGPVDRTVLLDPGEMSVSCIKDADLKYLDDIVVTHEHSDHFDLPLVQELAKRFPDVRILAPGPVVARLSEAGVQAGTAPPEGMELFDAPHEALEPWGQTPEAIGVHYLGALTHPGDNHHFTETKEILALPVTAPWGSTVAAARLAAALKPRYIIPIHDWPWKDEWRARMYGGLAEFFEGQGMTFIQPVDGEPFVLDVAVNTDG